MKVKYNDILKYVASGITSIYSRFEKSEGGV